ncbi:MAG: hypothetical protein IJ880_00955 [Bacilli bacterium]|nr:hypothetical protein [Bacilli bacterium]
MKTNIFYTEEERKNIPMSINADNKPKNFMEARIMDIKHYIKDPKLREELDAINIDEYDHSVGKHLLSILFTFVIRANEMDKEELDIVVTLSRRINGMVAADREYILGNSSYIVDFYYKTWEDIKWNQK